MYSGPLKECLNRFPPEQHQEQTWRWYRAQMRGWAGHWRERFCDAAILGKPVEEIGGTALSLAKVYRNEANKLKLAL
jgi:hypothetical protein